MALRILGPAVLVALFALTSCIEKTDGFFADSFGTSPPSDHSDYPDHSGPSVPPQPSQGHPGEGGPGKGGGNPAEPVPEPGTMFLLGTGLSGVAIYQRRRRREEQQAAQEQREA